MGLFNKAKLNKTEEELLQKMMHSKLVDWLIDTIMYNPKYQWAKTGNHGEYGRREVTVYPHWYLVEKPGAYKKGDTEHCIAINYQKSGYSPLSPQSGISLSRMCYLYATAIQRRLKAEMPDYEFMPVSSDHDTDQLAADGDAMLLLGLLLNQGVRAKFVYYVPVPESSDLF